MPYTTTWGDVTHPVFDFVLLSGKGEDERVDDRGVQPEAGV